MLNSKFVKIQQLKGIEFERIKAEEASQEEITNYLKRINSFENVNLDHQKDIASKKLSLMRIGQKYLDGSLSQQLLSIQQNLHKQPPDKTSSKKLS